LFELKLKEDSEFESRLHHHCLEMEDLYHTELNIVPIAATNNGKSTLMNALSNLPEIFHTAANRETNSIWILRLMEQDP
jgi:predicted GTPase